MKRTIAVFVGLTMGALAVLGVIAAGGRAAPRSLRPAVAPFVFRDTGPGEYLLLVVGGVYDTEAAAEAGSAQMTFGDVQGYYVVPTAQFQDLRRRLARPGEWALVSAFRTELGAQEFARLAREVFGVPSAIVSGRVMSLGGVYAGLGQEAAPDGAGPLLYPIPQSLRP